MQIETIDDLPSFPFCSERCRLVDLGRWIDGDYAIAASKLGETSPGENGGDPPQVTNGDGMSAVDDAEQED